jgi:hypothetical protein
VTCAAQALAVSTKLASPSVSETNLLAPSSATRIAATAAIQQLSAAVLNASAAAVDDDDALPERTFTLDVADDDTTPRQRVRVWLLCVA